MATKKTSEFATTTANQLAKVKRRKVVSTFKEPSKTQQHFKDEVNVNNIVKKFTETGQVSHLNHSRAQYGEAPDVDFRSAMDIVQKAQETFDSLPSELRKRFGNDPANYLEFVQNPENIEEMYDLGMISSMPNYDEAPASGASSENPATTDVQEVAEGHS